MKLTEKQIELAVNWWGEALRNPKFQTLSQGERSDPGSRPAAMAEIMAKAFHKEPPQDIIEQFKKALAEKLKAGNTYLSVDYHPSKTLADALEEAGADGGMRLPWKTHMNFNEDGSVEVACGYGEPFVTLA